MSNQRFYRLDSGKIYDTENKSFIPIDDSRVINYVQSGGTILGPFSSENLKNNILRFYNLEIGDCLLNLEELRSRRLIQLRTMSRKYDSDICPELSIKSQDGVVIDSDMRSYHRIKMLIDHFEAIKDTYGEFNFIDKNDKTLKYTNTSRLEKMLQDIALNIYKVKTQIQNYREFIIRATTIQSLINLNFNISQIVSRNTYRESLE